MEDWIKLNVGGEIFVTKRKTLRAEPESMLAKMFDPESKFAPPFEHDGVVYLDEDPEIFKYVLRYLRKGCETLDVPPMLLYHLKADADFFGLEGLAEFCEGELQKIEEEKVKKNYPNGNKRVETGTLQEVKIRFGWQIERVISEGTNKLGDCAIISKPFINATSREDDKQYKLVTLELADKFVDHSSFGWKLERVVREASLTDKVIFSKIID